MVAARKNSNAAAALAGIMRSLMKQRDEALGNVQGFGSSKTRATGIYATGKVGTTVGQNGATVPLYAAIGTQGRQVYPSYKTSAFVVFGTAPFPEFSGKSLNAVKLYMYNANKALPNKVPIEFRLEMDIYKAYFTGDYDGHELVEMVYDAVKAYNKSPAKDTYNEVWARTVPAATVNSRVKSFTQILHTDPQKDQKLFDASLRVLKQYAKGRPHLRSVVAGIRNPFNVSQAPTDNKLFAQQPTKREVKHMISHWTTEAYRNLQAARRTDSLPRNRTLATTVQKLNSALALHMKKYALRAPQMPPKVRNVVTGSATPVLYRGVRLTPGQLVNLMEGELHEKGYMAFSRNPSYSMHFVTRSRSPDHIVVLLRLSVTDVENGTPWIWYASQTEVKGKTASRYQGSEDPYITKQHFLPGENTPRLGHSSQDQGFDKTFVRGSWDNEFEVLLPPGKLRLASSTMRKMHQVKRSPGNADPIAVMEWDVRYTPDREAATLWAKRNQGGRGPVRQRIV